MKKKDSHQKISHQTLCVIHDDARILLGLKKIGLGKGYWNSVGGHVDPGEKVHEAAIREVFEELGIVVSEVEKIGFLKIEGVLEGLIHLHIFKAREYSGTPIESNEVKPSWFKLDSVPYENMWPNDKHWLPIFLGGDKFVGSFVYDDGELVRQEIKVTENLPKESQI